MTDRELLEMAAKAAGIEGRYASLDEFPDWMTVHDGEGVYYTTSQAWNPLTDDGDALRLAVKLGIDIEWRADGRVAAYRHANANGHCFTAFESSREDRATNTRRAIVRAAAEIGKGMK